MSEIGKNGELRDSSDVRELNRDAEVSFSKESLEWYGKLMDEDAGKLSEDETVFDKDEAKQETDVQKPEIYETAAMETAQNKRTAGLESNVTESSEAVERAAIMPRNGGEWSGEPGDSVWYPDRETAPGDRHGTNPEHKSWGEILDNYRIDGVEFKDGEADFSEVARGTVEIDDFSDDRVSNFTQADEKLAEACGCEPEEVAGWRKENAYTWHECKDMSTMLKVPTEVHGNIPHSGGISEYKAKNPES